MVVLGLITTKRGELENADELVARIEEASGHIDRERLALSPQCGFGTSIIRNQLTHDQQAAKLRLVCKCGRKGLGLNALLFGRLHRQGVPGRGCRICRQGSASRPARTRRCAWARPS
jgi:hypothetical protein